MNKPAAIVLLSGGMDSLVCLAEAAREHPGALAVLHMDYGQRTSAKERACFERIADHYSIPAGLRKVVDMGFLRQIGGSSLTDEAMAVKAYDGDGPGIPSSYVPFRNTIILSLAVSWAEVLGAEKLYIGANHEDSPGYPDCRPEYYQAFNQVAALGTKEGKIRVETPVLRLRKKEVVQRGTALQAPFALSWSCYAEGDVACGKCDSCALRLRGFREAGILDPIPYR